MTPPGDRRNDRIREETQAQVHVSKWSPLVWVVPAIAIIFVGWLVVRYGFFGGGDITVRFAEARGLDRYSPVRFRGAKVGTVQKITVDEKMGQVVVHISMDAAMNHALRKGTRFWIIEPGLEGGGLGGLLGGTYVGIAPAQGEADGEEVREFVGQEYAPVVSPPEAGVTVVLEGQGVGALTIGSPVQFEGMRVGRVLGSEYDPKRGTTSVHAFIVQRFAHHVRQSSRFYRGGGMNLTLGGGGVSMAGASLGSLLNAPIEFYTPDVMAGVPVANGTRFVLHDSKPAAIASADGPHLTYLTYFTGSLHGLKPGTPVTMKGKQVGRVREVRLRYVPENATLESPVTIEIDPRELEFPVDDTMSRVQLRADFNAALAKLVNKGMRATLATSLVLPGASAVALENVARAGTGRLNTASEPPIIPAAAGGGGLESAMGAIQDVAGRIRAFPIEQIGANLRNASQRINSIVSDPILDESLQRMNRSMADVERAAKVTRENIGPIAESMRKAADSAEQAANTVRDVTAKAGANIDPIVQSLRNAASSAEAAAGRAEQLMGTSARQNYDLGELIKELTRAAEAVRALAAYIAENPDALLKGRAK